MNVTGAFYVGLLDRLLDSLLGVAGIMKLIGSQWIIPENSLQQVPVVPHKAVAEVSE